MDPNRSSTSSSSQKREYDAALGGSVQLPSHVSTFRYAQAAIRQIRGLLKHSAETSGAGGGGLVFQQLPKRMRRRAMSHHPKRLPRKYREAHTQQMRKSGMPKKQTTNSSRRYRRRARNLLREYVRRQRRQVWLETHIWHARRFHMVERWGYRLPYASCDKTYRACYRASAKHCLLQDISYYACIELDGAPAELRAGFAALTSNECGSGLSVTAVTYLNGRREGSMELFRAGQYPRGALGRVHFMWRPIDEGQKAQQRRTLWLWVHPSTYTAVLEELIKTFELVSLRSVKVPIEADDINTVEKPADAMEVADDTKPTGAQTKATKVDSSAMKPARQLQFMTKLCAWERIKRYANAARTLQLSELKDTMNRFRLTGPLAQCVLAHAFKVRAAPVAAATVAAATTPPSTTTTTRWYDEQSADFQASHCTQAEYWQRCQALSTPTALLSNMILALNIDDPRVHRPQRRTKAQPQHTEESAVNADDLLLDMPSGLAQSALWDATLRERISKDMVGQHAYCTLRQRHALLPGAMCGFEEQLQPVPVLLLQRPGSQQPHLKRLGYGCGWDIIVPAGYGMPVWLSLIMWGARPGGLRESDSLARELGCEQHLPDTFAGRQYAVEHYAELHERYFRLPPNKRCNYRKFSIASPFRAPFVQLVRDWSTPSNTVETQSTSAASTGAATNAASAYFVSRNRVQLQALNTCLKQRSQHAAGIASFPKQLLLQPGCLIQLQLRMKSRGRLNEYALICLPDDADLKRHLRQLRRADHTPVHTEPLLPDLNEQERKLSRLMHKRLLKRLRARRVREKHKAQETATRRVYIRPAGTAQLVSEQRNKMCALWLPQDCAATEQSVRRQCTREVIGYVTSSAFSLLEATVCAVGYVSAEALQQLIERCQRLRLGQPTVLVRPTDSQHYRFASFKVNEYV